MDGLFTLCYSIAVPTQIRYKIISQSVGAIHVDAEQLPAGYCPTGVPHVNENRYR